MSSFSVSRHVWRYRKVLQSSWGAQTCQASSLYRHIWKRPSGLSKTGLGQLKNPHSHFRPRSRSYTAESFKQFSEDNPILLRDACQCSRCIDTSTQQRDFSFSDIPTNISVSSVEPDAETKTWKVRWTNDVPGYDGHISMFSEPTLTQLLEGTPAGLDVKRVVSLWDGSSFAQETKDVDFYQFLDNDEGLSSALDLIERHGLVFITGIPEDPEAVRQMVSRLGRLRNTFYGETWNVRSVPQAKNVAYTSKILGFHMDLLYMKEPPGVQFLHCLQNSCQGGESEFADTFKAIDVLRQERPECVDRLAQSKIRYGYSNDGFFYSDDKPVIKVSNSQHAPSPTILNATDPGFMSTVDRVYWSPPFINSIANAAHDGNIKEFVEASKAFAEVMHRPELIYETKLAAGTCAVFDNLRVVHARKAFDMNSGKRWLKGIYADRQDVLSNSLKHVWKEQL